MKAALKTWLASNSKKLWVTLVGIGVVILQDAFGLSEEQVEKIVAIGIAYVVAQGIGADFGKSKAKLENGKPPVAP